MVRTRLMREFGTTVVAGVTPGKGGMEVEGIPVYDSVKEAVKEKNGIDISVIFVPAPLVKNAALEAFFAGIKLAVIIPDRVPVYDVMTISKYAKIHDASFIGPNTLGILTPQTAVLGMIGGKAKSAREWFKKGPVGITSRSGGMTTSTAYYLNKAGMGQSTIVHVGGDSIVGMPHPKVVSLFEEDKETKAVVMFGEIGGTQEEEVAEMMISKKFTKPLIAYIGGKGAKEGTQFSHAGAIIEGGMGTHSGKVEKLRKAGAIVVESFNDIPEATKDVLDRIGEPYVY